MGYDELFENAKRIIQRSRNLTELMMEKGFIPEAPESPEEEADV
jgi:hypothetical protein